MRVRQYDTLSPSSMRLLVRGRHHYIPVTLSCCSHFARKRDHLVQIDADDDWTPKELARTVANEEGEDHLDDSG